MQAAARKGCGPRARRCQAPTEAGAGQGCRGCSTPPAQEAADAAAAKATAPTADESLGQGGRSWGGKGSDEGGWVARGLAWRPLLQPPCKQLGRPALHKGPPPLCSCCSCRCCAPGGGPGHHRTAPPAAGHRQAGSWGKVGRPSCRRWTAAPCRHGVGGAGGQGLQCAQSWLPGAPDSRCE